MAPDIRGLHHVTAISRSARGNAAFYTGALGLRLVKKTVNFDDPSTYHLYYADEQGTPGTVMTFFPWEGMRQGQPGAGQVAITQFAIPEGAAGFWIERLPEHGAALVADEELFGERRAVFTDPDGLLIALVEAPDDRAPWLGAGIPAESAITGFHGVTLALRDGAAVADILTEIFGYEAAGTEALGRGAIARYRLPGAAAAEIVDLHVDPAMPTGLEGSGTVHHVAFSVDDRAAQTAVRSRMLAAGLQVTHSIDRDYFWAIYARVPGGILFEVATAEPGFTTDEPVEALGDALMLPRQHEPMRASIEAHLPALD